MGPSMRPLASSTFLFLRCAPRPNSTKHTIIFNLSTRFSTQKDPSNPSIFDEINTYRPSTQLISQSQKEQVEKRLFDAFTVNQLKLYLKQVKLPLSGRKKDLVARLFDFWEIKDANENYSSEFILNKVEFFFLSNSEKHPIHSPSVIHNVQVELDQEKRLIIVIGERINVHKYKSSICKSLESITKAEFYIDHDDTSTFSKLAMENDSFLESNSNNKISIYSMNNENIRLVQDLVFAHQNQILMNSLDSTALITDVDSLQEETLCLPYMNPETIQRRYNHFFGAQLALPSKMECGMSLSPSQSLTVSPIYISDELHKITDAGNLNRPLSFIFRYGKWIPFVNDSAKFRNILQNSVLPKPLLSQALALEKWGQIKSFSKSPSFSQKNIEFSLDQGSGLRFYFMKAPKPKQESASTVCISTSSKYMFDRFYMDVDISNPELDQTSIKIGTFTRVNAMVVSRTLLNRDIQMEIVDYCESLDKLYHNDIKVRFLDRMEKGLVQSKPWNLPRIRIYNEESDSTVEFQCYEWEKRKLFSMSNELASNFEQELDVQFDLKNARMTRVRKSSGLMDPFYHGKEWIETSFQLTNEKMDSIVNDQDQLLYSFLKFMESIHFSDNSFLKIRSP